MLRNLSRKIPRLYCPLDVLYLYLLFFFYERSILYVWGMQWTVQHCRTEELEFTWSTLWRENHSYIWHWMHLSGQCRHEKSAEKSFNYWRIFYEILWWVVLHFGQMSITVEYPQKESWSEFTSHPSQVLEYSPPWTCKPVQSADFAFRLWSRWRACHPPVNANRCSGRMDKFIRLILTCYDEQFSFKRS